MRRSSIYGLAALSVILGVPAFGLSADLDEFKVKRQEVFEFTESPRIRLDGDRAVLTFASKGNCDVTVAIEDGVGKIVRHLACGVLGPNAPAPFQKDSLKQTLTWDGKDDRGVIIENKQELRARVSLGLKPQFERTLFWQPKRRPGIPAPLMAPTPEGVYVFQGGKSIDSLILYDHDGNYLRTVYPFPGGKIDKVQGLRWASYPQDGQKEKLPLKTNYLQDTMLTSGSNATGTAAVDPKTGEVILDKNGHPEEIIAFNTAHFGMYGTAATCMAVTGNRIALANRYINRLGTDGASAGMDLRGPKVSMQTGDTDIELGQGSPMSAAMSPDGKRLYLTGYVYARIQRATQDIAKLADCRAIPVVMKVDMDSNDAATVFAGALPNGKPVGDVTFKVPTSVAVDNQGRVYVGDYMNDVIQVFSPDGKLVKSVPAYRPAGVAVHPKTGEIYVFSWWVRNQYEDQQCKRLLTRYGPLDNPKKVEAWELASQSHFAIDWGASSPVEFLAAIDFNVSPARVWLGEYWTNASVLSQGAVKHSSVQILDIKPGALEKVRDFAEDVAKDAFPMPTAVYQRPRLYVSPANGMVYVAEGDDSAEGKSFREMFEIDPATGKHRQISLPFDAEDMCFDINGLAYLRSVDVVVRYDPKTWREVPWDYGEERDRVAFGWMSSTRTAKATSGLAMPADAGWHHGGMFVSPRGHLLVACGYNVVMDVRTSAKYVFTGKKYQVKVYPGRVMGGRGGISCLHVWDTHGKLIHEDMVPGLNDLYGVGLDKDDNCYFMAAAPRMLGDKPYPNPYAGTLLKFPPNGGQVISVGKNVPMPLSDDSIPKRAPDLVGGQQGQAWAVGASWFYGGVGFGGKNTNGCACQNARMTLDYFSRTFAPELDRYKVAVLDSSGNLILRIGRYGNVDDGQPIDRAGGPAGSRAIGGDEVALFHGAYLAADTDHRLFVADPGNGRVLSIKLDYQATERVPLK